MAPSVACKAANPRRLAADVRDNDQLVGDYAEADGSPSLPAALA